MTVVAAAAYLSMLCGCASAPPAGVTTGGQQDIAAARSSIEDGGIPNPESITVEGFLSEHSIPVDEPEDAGLLYAAASAAWNGDFDVFMPLATVVIGVGTTIDDETFERDPLNLCLLIDRSGSMGDAIDLRTETSKLDAVKIAIDRLLGQLDAGDRVSIVAFSGSSRLVLESVPGNDITTIKSALDTLEADGGTELAAAMGRAYRVLIEHSTSSSSDRLFIFTDAQLSSWAEWRVERFFDVMEELADDNVGATVFGIGSDFGHEIAYDISQVRGGNYFFLSDYERIVTVFDEEFDYLVTPVAYDVSFQVSIPFGFDVAGVYGIPVEDPLAHVFDLEIPTLFLSRRQGGGAILIRLRPGTFVDIDMVNTLADISFSYTTPQGERVEDAPIRSVLPGGFDPDVSADYFESNSAKRAVLLLNTALVMRNSCEDASWGYWSGSYDRAVTRLTEFLPYFDALAEGLEDRVSDSSRSLSQERALLEQLHANIQRRW